MEPGGDRSVSMDVMRCDGLVRIPRATRSGLGRDRRADREAWTLVLFESCRSCGEVVSVSASRWGIR